MSTQAQLSPQIQEQAAEWFVKFRKGELRLSEREEFIRWLHQSPQHVQAYVEEARTYWDTVPLTTCDRLTNRLEEPCSAARTQGACGGTRR